MVVNACRALFLALVCLASIGSRAAALTACGEPSDNSTRLRWVLDAKGQRTSEVTGFTVFFLKAAFAKMGKDIQIRGDLPWSRCLRMVAVGAVDFAPGAYFDEFRAKTLAYSKPYQTYTPQVFYLTRKPISINSIDDLHRFRGCGMNGSSYAHYGLLPGQLDQGTKSFKALADKLKAGYCDYFVEELEVLNELALQGLPIMSDPEISHGPVRGAIAPGLHLVAGKNSLSRALLGDFDKAVAAMVSSGEFDKLWRQYVLKKAA